LIAAGSFSSAEAVGLGPLTGDGLTNSERKGFYLTLINPYPSAARFRLYSVAWDSEDAVARVQIQTATPLLAPKSQRQVLVIATGLAKGEQHRFRVCAERMVNSGEELINARVCSKLTARRVA
jgi:hypothetical protein